MKKDQKNNGYYEICGELTYYDHHGNRPSHSHSWTGRVELHPDGTLIGYVQDDSALTDEKNRNSYQLMVGYHRADRKGLIAYLFGTGKNSSPMSINVHESQEDNTMSGTIANQSNTKRGNLTNVELRPLALSDEQAQEFDATVQDTMKQVEESGNATEQIFFEKFSTMSKAEIEKRLSLEEKAKAKGKGQPE